LSPWILSRVPIIISFSCVVICVYVGIVECLNSITSVIFSSLVWVDIWPRRSCGVYWRGLEFWPSTSLSSARPNNCDISILRIACVLGENVLNVCAYDKKRLSMWSSFVWVLLLFCFHDKPSTAATSSVSSFRYLVVLLGGSICVGEVTFPLSDSPGSKSSSVIDVSWICDTDTLEVVARGATVSLKNSKWATHGQFLCIFAWPGRSF